MAKRSAGTVCVVGSINLDTVTKIERLPEVGETILGQPLGLLPGGKGFNQAVAALRGGAIVRFCGQVGDDAPGQQLMNEAARRGLQGHLGVSSEVPTGTAFVAVLPGSDNSIIVARGANGTLGTESIVQAVQDADVVLTQLEIDPYAAEVALDTGRQVGAKTILNASPAEDVTTALLSLSDVVVVNESEAEVLGGPEKILSHGPEIVVVTLGSAGLRCWKRDGEAISLPAFPIDPVDTTGSGDAFSGVFASTLSGGADLDEALAKASAAGAITAMTLGAQAEEMTTERIDQLVASLQPTD